MAAMSGIARDGVAKLNHLGKFEEARPFAFRLARSTLWRLQSRRRRWLAAGEAILWHSSPVRLRRGEPVFTLYKRFAP